MLRWTVPLRVHLFSALVPANTVKAPRLISLENADIAKSALLEAEPLIGKAPFVTALDLLTDLSNFRKQREADLILEDCMTFYRGELYKPAVSDPFQRLQLHEAIMAAGFYQRSAKNNALKGENTRFVLHHYNFDVRRDVAISRSVRNSLLDGHHSTPQSDKLLGDLLLLERRLFGQLRFGYTAGRQWFVLGLPFDDIKTDSDIYRLLNIDVVRDHGNFELVEDDSQKLWKKMIVTPKPEATASFLEEGDFMTHHAEKDMRFEIQVQKPAPPVEFWDRVKDTLLRYWVLWFSMWVMFFMVDEEIITIVALIFLKRQQTKILEEEAEKTGSKVYIASSLGGHLKETS